MAETEVVVTGPQSPVVAVAVQPTAVAVVTTVAPVAAAVPVREPSTAILAVQPSQTIEVGQPSERPFIVVRPTAAASGGDASGLVANTADTAQQYKLLLFSDGTVRAIPASADPPAQVTGLSVTAFVARAELSWSTADRASAYQVFRNSTLIATTTATAYVDRGAATGTTPSYRVRAVDTYGQLGEFSATAGALLDPDLNVAPTVAITVWPSPIVPGQPAIVRVNASDVDGQPLELTLDSDYGTLTATDDPSVWVLTI